MAKELTREERIKKQYSELHKLNQRLKNIASCYYIHHDGVVYVKALVSFTEVLVKLRYPEKLDLFYGAVILPNEFFKFTKSAKKTKMTITEDTHEGTKRFIFGQDDDEELTYTLNIANVYEPNSSASDTFLNERIISKMYKRYFELNTDMYIPCKDRDQDHKFTAPDVEELATSQKAMFLDFHGTQLTITKNLFLDIKKTDSISISRNCYQKVDQKGLCRMFYIITHNTDLYDSYTIFNVLQQLPK